MTIRLASEKDIAAIRAVALATWPVAYASILSPAQMSYMLELMYAEHALKKQMTRSGHRFLVAEKDKLITGFVSFETGHKGRNIARLHKLYVTPITQGTGTGKALLAFSINAARSAGDTVLELNVNKHNKAKDFYLHHGFTVVRDEVIDIGQGFAMDDHVLQRVL